MLKMDYQDLFLISRQSPLAGPPSQPNGPAPHAQHNYPAVATIPGTRGPARDRASEHQLASATLAGAAVDARAATGRLASDEAAGLAAAGLAGVGDDAAAGILACDNCSAGASHAF